MLTLCREIKAKEHAQFSLTALQLKKKQTKETKTPNSPQNPNNT